MSATQSTSLPALPANPAPLALPALPARPALPCFPCPYNASCCAYGTSLSDEEAAAIQADHGPGLVYRTRWGEWRTRVRNKRCVMFRDGGCTIHARSYYPSTCRGFPWIDANGEGRYEYDLEICGAFVEHPELVAIQRAIPSASEHAARAAARAGASADASAESSAAIVASV